MRRAAARSPLLGLLGVLVEISAHAGSTPAAAETRASAWPPKALANVEVSSRATRNDDTGVFSYTLTVSNPATNVLPVDLVEVDVSLPHGRTAPNDFVPSPDVTFDDPFRPFRSGPAFPGGYDRPVDYMRRIAREDLLRVGLTSPPGWHSWLSLSPRESPIGLRLVAGWGHEGYEGPTPGVPPGASVSGFRIESSLPPGIRIVLLRPSFADLETLYAVPEEWRTSSEDSDAEIEEKNRRVATLSLTAVALAPMPPSGWGLGAIAEGIAVAVDEAASVGWVPDAATSTGLRQDAEGLVALAIERDRDGLLAALAAYSRNVRALPASRIRPEAADLLALNAEFLAGRVERELPPPASLVLAPGRDRLPVDQTVTLRATLLKGEWPLQGDTVTFTVLEGPHAGFSDSCQIGASGECSFSYRGTAVGLDKVHARWEFYGSKPDSGARMEPEEIADAFAWIEWDGGPDLAVQSLFPPAIRIPFARPNVDIEETTINIGSTAAPESVTTYFLSRDRLFDPDDFGLGDRPVDALGPGDRSSSVLSFPVPALDPGVYWLLACADAPGQISELDETNNCQALEVFVGALVDVVPPDPPTTTSADLEVVETVSAPLVAVGEPAIFATRITNLGPSAASGVNLWQDVPDGFELVSASADGRVCEAPWPVLCPLGDLPPGGQVTLSVVARAVLVGTYRTRGLVAGNEPDPVAANNSAEAAIAVVSADGAAIPSLSFAGFVVLAAFVALVAVALLRRGGPV